MSTEKGGKNPAKPRYGIFEFVIGGLVCVGVPALMTGAAPVSWLEFQRTNQQVSVKTQTCIFFIAPYRTQELADVREVSTTFRQGELLHKRIGDGKKGRAESEAAVILHGPKKGDADGEIVKVAVSPASYKSVEEKIKAFLADPNQKTLSLFAIANWKVGLIFAIPFCLLTVLFVVGWSIWLGQVLARPFQFFKSSSNGE